MKTSPLIAVAAVALLAAGAPGAVAAPTCPRGKAAWTVEGRTLCVKQARIGTAGSGAPAAEAVRRWMQASTSKGGRMRLPRRLRKAMPAAERAAAKLMGGTLGARTSAAGGRFDVALPTVKLPGGVRVEARARRAGGDAELEIEAVAPNRERVVWRPVASDVDDRGPEVGCPTAEGHVSSVDVESVGGTTTVMRRRRVLSARTVRQRVETKAEGLVAEDARLSEVHVTVTSRLEIYERGRQVEAHFTRTFIMPPAGPATDHVSPELDARVRDARNSRAHDRREALEVARRFAQQEAASPRQGAYAEAGRDRLVQAEPGWYELPNPCVTLRWEPRPGIGMEEGMVREVSLAAIAARDGGEPTGTAAVTSVSQGAFTVTRPALGAGTPAVFIAKAGKANSAKRTVAAGVIVTSRAGRGQGDWFATAIHAKVPTGFTVTMSANARSTMTGHAVEFDAFATYTLRSTASGPDGSTTAWYDLEEGGVETGRATLDRTSGCRYEAPLSGDGELQSADFELRVLPNGEVVYGFLYHTRFHGTYVATDCPPGTVMPPVETDIAVKLDSRRPGPQSLRSGPASFEFDVTDATDAQAGVYDKVTASWLVAPH